MSTYYVKKTFNEFIPFETEIYPGQYIGSAILAAMPVVGQKANAALAFMNKYGSNSSVNIESVRLINLGLRKSSISDLVGLQKVYGSISATGGDDLLANVVKMDTNSPDVSGLNIKQNIYDLSYSSSDYIDSTSIPTQCLSYQGLSAIFCRNFGDSKLSPIAIFDTGKITQPLILRQNEGLCIPDNATIPFNSVLMNMECVFSINGNAYFWTSDLQFGQPYESGNAPSKWALWNTGTDAINVHKINFRETGSTFDVFSISLEKISSIVQDGQTLSVIKMDTSSGDLDSNILIQTKAVVALYGGEHYRFLPPTYRRSSLPFYGNGVALTCSLHNWAGNPYSETLFSGDLNLRQGEGMAVIVRSPCGLGNYGLEVQFSVSDDTIPSSGSGTRSRFIKPSHRTGFRT